MQAAGEGGLPGFPVAASVCDRTPELFLPGHGALLATQALRSDDAVSAGGEVVLDKGSSRHLGHVAQVDAVDTAQRLVELAGQDVLPEDAWDLVTESIGVRTNGRLH